MAEDDRFWELELDDKNIKDLLQWVIDNSLVGLVDEEAGGIVGYISRDHIKGVLTKLNK